MSVEHDWDDPRAGFPTKDDDVFWPNVMAAVVTAFTVIVGGIMIWTAR